MAVYKSKYSELTFYVKGEARSFKNGRYSTEDKESIKILDSLADAIKVEEPKKNTNQKQTKAEESAKQEKAPTTRRRSAKGTK